MSSGSLISILQCAIALKFEKIKIVKFLIGRPIHPSPLSLCVSIGIRVGLSLLSDPDCFVCDG